MTKSVTKKEVPKDEVETRCVVLFGSTGQVGSEVLVKLGAKLGIGDSLHAPSRQEVDLTDHEAVGAYIATTRPDWVINTAAYTAVDDAESNSSAAYSLNHDAVESLVSACADQGSSLLHLSTDYVFDGQKDGWYVETDEPNPLSVYGASKLAGESVVDTYERGIVLRTSWVYGVHGANFVKTMRRLALERDSFGVVADQFGCPTAAHDLADAIAKIVTTGSTPDRRGDGSGSVPTSGLFHIAGSGATSWWGFADEALSFSGLREAVELEQLTTDQYPTAAKRPANSRLDCSLLEQSWGITMPDWRVSLASVIARLGNDPVWSASKAARVG